MRLTEENLRELKSLFSESIGELIKNEVFMSKMVAVIKERFVEEIDNLKAQNDSLRKENMLLGEKLDNLDQSIRRSSVRIFGVPEEPRESVENKIVTLFTDQMGVSVSVSDIDRCQRVGAFSNNNKYPRPVVVRFVSHRHKVLVCRARKGLKGTKIGIQEDLTARKYGLLKAAREKYGKKNCWSFDGRIFAQHNGTTLSITQVSDITINDKSKVSLIDRNFSLPPIS